MTISQLQEYLKKRAGGPLCGIVRYDGNSTDVLFLRDDVRERRMQSEIYRILNRVRPEASAKEEQSFPFGDLYATVRSFEDATFLHFPTGNDRGVVVSLEADATHNLNTFIGECPKRIEQ